MIPLPKVVSITIKIPLWSESTTNEIHLFARSMRYSNNWAISSHVSTLTYLTSHDYSGFWNRQIVNSLGSCSWLSLQWITSLFLGSYCQVIPLLLSQSSAWYIGWGPNKKSKLPSILGVNDVGISSRSPWTFLIFLTMILYPFEWMKWSLT